LFLDRVNGVQKQGILAVSEPASIRQQVDSLFFSTVPADSLTTMEEYCQGFPYFSLFFYIYFAFFPFIFV